MPESLSFRPHARLLTMLGEQLIKNDRIALVELVKNAYDADATRVDVDFRGFDTEGHATSSSSIIVTDNGTGMSEDVVRGAWMNPATPAKLNRKRTKSTTSLGRIMQGEKGIGRFASFKLGSVVMLTTRTAHDPEELSVLVDLSELDAVPDEGEEYQPLYLDEMGADLSRNSPRTFIKSRESKSFSDHGTQIEITSLRSEWSRQEFNDAFDDLERMQPLMWAENPPKAGASPVEDEVVAREQFEVRFLIDGIDQNLGGNRQSEVSALFDRAVLRVTNGRFDDKQRSYCLKVNDREVNLAIDSSEIRGIRPFKDRFGTEDNQPAVACGSFSFEFYIFDFSPSAPTQHELRRDDKEILRHHRVYLYRDGIRVYPYGDPEDDWLQVDRIRGTQSARSMFSNDQALGYVSITQADNPGLQDKTNREGLIDAGRASGDFIALIQTVLSWLRAKPYEQYAAANRRTKEQSLKNVGVFDRELSALINSGSLPKNLQQNLRRIDAAVTSERELAKVQLARTQDLAGVGLSVESASHDLIAAGTESLRLARRILTELRQLGLATEPVYADTASLVQRLEFVDSRFRDVQGLFVSTRQKRASLDVFKFIRRVKSMYASLHRDKRIEFQIDDIKPLKAMSTEAALLQCLINLVDNATYWLMSSTHEPRIIRVFGSGTSTIVVSDSGPGISPSDAEFIFEPFYSGKGDEGKGLGLFIAREVGIRNNFTVEIADFDDPRMLSGANFAVTFGEMGK